MNKFDKIYNMIIESRSPVVKDITDKSHPYWEYIKDNHLEKKKKVVEIDPTYWPLNNMDDRDPEEFYPNPFGPGQIRYGDIVDDYKRKLRKEGKAAFWWSTFDDEPVMVKKEGSKYYINDGTNRLMVAAMLGQNIDAVINIK